MTKNINILFLGGAKRVSLAEEFIRAGKELGINIAIFSYELNDDCPISFVGNVIQGKKWSDKSVITHISETIEKYKIDILLPFVDPATIIASEIKESSKNGVFIPVSDVEMCSIFFNKRLANNWCKENNIAIPKDDLLDFPLIAKPLEGSASKGIIILNNESELRNLEQKDKYLIQQFIKGEEYTIDIYRTVRTNKILSIVPRQRLETQGGESIKSITKRNAKIETFARNIIEKTKLVGALTLQILKDKEQNLFFMEINPRFGGGVLNSIAAGADSPMYLLRDFLKMDEFSNEKWTDNLMMIRRFKEYYKVKEYADNN
ncbi:MAG: ATP-grasp domain-containing protein [Capnocytophaga sp.]|nr:ATP-grasp domain-containing protein [Capnocytophaga sp.]